MTERMDFDQYRIFVDAVTSKPSTTFGEFIVRLHELYANGCEVQRLLTGAVGMTAESGEFMEIVKKLIFQGKPWNEENKYHLKRELGDILFYVNNACIALGTTIDEVAKMNVEKLEARYPNGFEIAKSEVRKQGDI